jgi:hypothetical protein
LTRVEGAKLGGRWNHRPATLSVEAVRLAAASILIVTSACAGSSPPSTTPPSPDPWVSVPLSPEEQSRNAPATARLPTRALLREAPESPTPTPSPVGTPGDVVLDDPRDDPGPLVRALARLTQSRLRGSRCCDNPGAFRCELRHLELVVRVDGDRVTRVGVGKTRPDDQGLAQCAASSLVGATLPWAGHGAEITERVIFSRGN